MNDDPRRRAAAKTAGDLLTGLLVAVVLTGCATSGGLIGPAADACFTITPPAPEAGENVRFNASPCGPRQYRWSFGDGTTAAGAIANHSYTADGTYTVEAADSECSGSPACWWATTQLLVGGAPDPEEPEDPDPDPEDPQPGECDPCPASEICMAISGIEDLDWRHAPSIPVHPGGVASVGGPAIFLSACDPPFEPSRGGVLIAGRFELHGGPTDGDPPWWARSRTAPITTSLGRFQGTAWVDELQCGIYDGRAINCHWWLVCSAATRQPYEATVGDQLTGRSQIITHAGGEPGAIYENLGAFGEPGCTTLGAGHVLIETDVLGELWKEWRASQ